MEERRKSTVYLKMSASFDNKHLRLLQDIIIFYIFAPSFVRENTITKNSVIVIVSKIVKKVNKIGAF